MKRIITLSLFLLLLFLGLKGYSQCGNPFMIGAGKTEKAFRNSAKNLIESVKSSPALRTSEVKDTITIPIVFNILYEDPLTDFYLLEKHRFQRAVDSANRYMNIDLQRIVEMNDPEFHDILDMPYIKMVIARLDPQGNPTDGFRYRQWVAINSNLICNFPYLEGQEAIKKQSKGGISQWNQRFYLNFWVGNFRNISGACFGGQSTYPSFPFLPGDPLSFMDGIILQSYIFQHNNFSDMRYFSTLIHEVGHYLGLIHTWGGIADDSQIGCDIDDLIDDTPNQYDATYNCRFDRNTCIDPVNDKKDMCSNVMDYADGVSFTKGQVAVMRSVLSGTRRLLPIPKMEAFLNVSNYTPCEGENITLEWFPAANHRFLFPSWDLTNKNLRHNVVITKDTTISVFITQGYDTLRKEVHIRLQQPPSAEYSTPDTVNVGDTLSLSFSRIFVYNTDVVHTSESDSVISWIVTAETDSFWVYFSNNCFSDSVLIQYVVREEEPTPIFDKNVVKILVYPNPSTDMVKLDYPDYKESNVIKVYNAQNKLVRKDFGKTINVSRLPAGNYFFTIETEGKVYMGKFMRQ